MATDIQAQTAARFLELQREFDARPLDEVLGYLSSACYAVTKTLTSDDGDEQQAIATAWERQKAAGMHNDADDNQADKPLAGAGVARGSPFATSPSCSARIRGRSRH